MTCPKCQTSNEAEAMYCLECGTALLATFSRSMIADSLAAAPTEALSLPVDSLVGRTIDGKYRIEEQLGAGGMGLVYRATRILIGDTVAVKILHSSEAAEAQIMERFRREAQLAAQLKHPNVVTVYDFGITGDGLCYLAMEHVEGIDLRSLIKQRGPVNLQDAVEITRQVCAALDEAHGHGIVHRDLKPENIIVHQTLNGLRVKVLDFGIAKLRDLSSSPLTQTGIVMGTPHYMSPEQCLGEELDARSDIYSLGIVLYEMLCGVVPFNSQISTAVVVQHVNQPPPAPRSINASIPAAVAVVVLHALEKRREARPGSANALTLELNKALEMATISAPTPNAEAIPFRPTPPSDFSAHASTPTMIMTTAPSGAYSTATPGFSSAAVRPVQRSSSGRWIPILLSIVALAVLATLGYLMLRQKSPESPLPDHYGLFGQQSNALTELRRRDYRNALEARQALVSEGGLPSMESKPVLLLYAEPQDVPLADLKLVQLDSIEPNGSVRLWNYQVSPVEGRTGMKRLKVAGGLPAGKFAFALFSGFLEEGQHRFWPFEVKAGVSQPEEPLVATITTKPKPSPTPLLSVTQQRPPVISAPPPAGARTAFCTENNVVLRSGPGLNAPKVGRLSRGERLWVIEYSSNYDTWRGFTSNWAYVQPENSATRGWVFAKFVGN